jgi:hypothetical protein
MGNRLDSILGSRIATLDSVNSTKSYNQIDMSATDGGYAVQFVYANGNGTVNMDLKIEGSLDGVHFSELATTNITADAGNHIYDVAHSNVTLLRVKILVTTGQADFTINFNSKARH